MDVFKDKSWVNLRRVDNDYMEALNAFLDRAFATPYYPHMEDKIACPCKICANRFFYERETVRAHLIMKGMDVDYQKCFWVFHGESIMDEYDVEDDIVDGNEFVDEKHYAGTKSPAIVHAKEEAEGNKSDKLETCLMTRKPEEGSKIDDASTKAKAEGNKSDRLETCLMTRKPMEGPKIDDAATKSEGLSADLLLAEACADTGDANDHETVVEDDDDAAT